MTRTTTDPNAALAHSDLVAANRYAATHDTAERVAAALGMTPAELQALTADRYTEVPAELLPGIAGLFVASVSAEGTGYLRPVLTLERQEHGYLISNEVDLRGKAVDPRAVAVQGITQHNAGWTVNGKQHTEDLTLQQYRPDSPWALTVAPYGAGLTDSARRKLDAAAPALAAWLITPARREQARLSLAVSSLGYAYADADKAAAVLTDGTRRAIAARDALAAVTR